MGPQARVDWVSVEIDGPATWDTRLLSIPGPSLGSTARITAAPNPLPGGATQTWTLIVDADAPAGTYTLAVLDAAGGVVRQQSLAVAGPGTRTTAWDGRNAFGTPVAAGVYFLQARAPDASVSTVKLVVTR